MGLAATPASAKMAVAAAIPSLAPAGDFFEPFIPCSLITPGFGGRVYFPTANGFIVLLVKARNKAPSTTLRQA
jgi:hypothetical protein